MLEKKLKKKNFRRLVYIVGCILEVLGFALLFNPSGTINYLSSNLRWVGMFVIFSGYMLAVSMRFKN